MKKTTIWVLGLFLLIFGGSEVEASLQEENEFTPLLSQSMAATREQVIAYFNGLGLPEDGKIYLYGSHGLEIMTSVEFSPLRHSGGQTTPEEQVNQGWYRFFTYLKNAASEEGKIDVLNKVFQLHSESIGKVDPLFWETMKKMGCKSPLEKRLVK